MLMRVYFFLNRRLNAQTRRKVKNMAARLEGGAELPWLKLTLSA